MIEGQEKENEEKELGVCKTLTISHIHILSRLNFSYICDAIQNN